MKQYTLLAIIFVSVLIESCNKSKDPTPVSSTESIDYNWYAGQKLSDQDTLKIENGHLYYSAEGLKTKNPAYQQFSMSWIKGHLQGDFEITITYDSLISGTGAPFSFTIFPNEGDLNKQTSVNIGENYAAIQYGNSGSPGGTPSLNYDFKLSNSGTIFIKREGLDFTITITKDYLNGSTPDQFVQQHIMNNWFSNDANFSFLVSNSLSDDRARVKWTSFSVKNDEGTLVDSFDSNLVLLK